MAPLNVFPWARHRVEIIRWCRDGVSMREIARRLGVTKGMVSGYRARLRQAGDLPPERPPETSCDMPGRARAWTADEKAEISRLYQVGFTYAQIAEKVQSTAGRIELLVLAMRRAGLLERRKKRASTTRPTPNKPRTRTVQERPAVKHMGSLSEVLESMKASAKAGVSLMDLRGMNCRWPLICDDGEVRYCGEGVADRPYCAHHAARAFNGKDRPRVPPAVLGLGVRQGGRVDA